MRNGVVGELRKNKGGEVRGSKLWKLSGNEGSTGNE